MMQHSRINVLAIFHSDIYPKSLPCWSSPPITTPKTTSPSQSFHITVFPVAGYPEEFPSGEDRRNSAWESMDAYKTPLCSNLGPSPKSSSKANGRTNVSVFFLSLRPPFFNFMVNRFFPKITSQRRTNEIKNEIASDLGASLLAVIISNYMQKHCFLTQFSLTQSLFLQQELTIRLIDGSLSKIKKAFDKKNAITGVPMQKTLQELYAYVAVTYFDPPLDPLEPYQYPGKCGVGTPVPISNTMTLLQVKQAQKHRRVQWHRLYLVAKTNLSMSPFFCQS